MSDKLIFYGISLLCTGRGELLAFLCLLIPDEAQTLDRPVVDTPMPLCIQRRGAFVPCLMV